MATTHARAGCTQFGETPFCVAISANNLELLDDHDFWSEFDPYDHNEDEEDDDEYTPPCYNDYRYNEVSGHTLLSLAIESGWAFVPRLLARACFTASVAEDVLQSTTAGRRKLPPQTDKWPSVASYFGAGGATAPGAEGASVAAAPRCDAAAEAPVLPTFLQLVVNTGRPELVAEVLRASHKRWAPHSSPVRIAARGARTEALALLLRSGRSANEVDPQHDGAILRMSAQLTPSHPSGARGDAASDSPPSTLQQRIQSKQREADQAKQELAAATAALARVVQDEPAHAHGGEIAIGDDDGMGSDESAAGAAAKLKQALQKNEATSRKKAKKLEAEAFGLRWSLENQQSELADSRAQGASPLHLLALAGSEELADGAPYLFGDSNPLGVGFLEARERAAACAALLLSHGADPCAKDAVRANALHTRPHANRDPPSEICLSFTLPWSPAACRADERHCTGQLEAETRV